jgi:chitodextrinase
VPDPYTPTATSQRHFHVAPLTVILVALMALVALADAGPHRAVGAGATWNAHLWRYPYLTDLVDQYATINWATDRSETAALATWGQVGTESCTAHRVAASRSSILVNDVPLYQWKAQLDLTPGTSYCYRVYLGAAGEIDLLGSDSSPQFMRQVPMGSTAPFTFAVFGDWGRTDADGNPPQTNLMEVLANSEARFAVTTGDNAYPAGSQANYGDLVQQASGVFGPTFWKLPGASVALFPTIGNHGFDRTELHPHLVNWPQERAVALSGGRYIRETYCCRNDIVSDSYPSTWYAFDAGNARLYVLEAAWSDSNLGTASEYQNDYDFHWRPASDEYQWLEQDLAAHPTALKFAFFHYPLYSDMSTEPSNTLLQGADSLEGLLSRYGVNLAFAGHGHIYQRNVKPHAGSLVTYVTGGGGALLQPIGALGCSEVDAYGIGWSYSMGDGSGGGSACGSAPVPRTPWQVHHILLVHVNGTTVTVEPINAQGRSFDVQTYDFAAQPDSAPPTTPAGIAASINQDRLPTLRWDAAHDDTALRGYTIYRDGGLLATVPAAQLDYSDATAAPSTSYIYTLDAFDAQGNHSLSSAAITLTTPAPDTTAPNTPTGITALFVSPTRVDLTWTAASDDTAVIGYIIRRNGVTLARVTETSFSDDIVQPATSYRYTVAAFDRAGNASAPSAAITVKTPAVVLLPLVVR